MCLQPPPFVCYPGTYSPHVQPFPTRGRTVRDPHTSVRVHTRGVRVIDTVVLDTEYDHIELRTMQMSSQPQHKQKRSGQSAPSRTPRDAVTCVNTDYCTRLAAGRRGALPFIASPASVTRAAARCTHTSLRFPPTNDCRMVWGARSERDQRASQG
ncbi:hypothetical protein B5X24_HaOG216625 [Helicoverpa armigera]|nr:hypothetical protein B5X24_HaOG216625 [Helicoverpa armigera]